MLTSEEITKQIEAWSVKGSCKKCNQNEWGFHRTKNKIGRHCKNCRNLRCKKYQEKLKANGGSHTKKQWLELLSKYDSCPFCNRKWEDLPPRISKRRLSVITKEHIVEVINSGSNDIANIIPCCYQCNSSGGGKLHGKNH